MMREGEVKKERFRLAGSRVHVHSLKFTVEWTGLCTSMTIYEKIDEKKNKKHDASSTMQDRALFNGTTSNIDRTQVDNGASTRQVGTEE